MIALVRALIFFCYGFLMLGVQGFTSLAAPQSFLVDNEAGHEVLMPFDESRIDAVAFGDLKGLAESSLLGTSVPTAPFLKRSIDSHSPAIQQKAIAVISTIKRSCARAASIKQLFGVPDLIFPFHYFP